MRGWHGPSARKWFKHNLREKVPKAFIVEQRQRQRLAGMRPDRNRGKGQKGVYVCVCSRSVNKGGGIARENVKIRERQKERSGSKKKNTDVMSNGRVQGTYLEVHSYHYLCT